MGPTYLAGPLGTAAVIGLGGLAPLLALPLLLALIGKPLVPLSQTVVSLAEDICKVAGALARSLLLVLALGMLATVVLRYVFGESATWMSEAVLYAHGTAFLLAAPLALIDNEHVRVDVFYERALPTQRALVDLIGYTFLLVPVMLLLLVEVGPFVELAWATGERSTQADGLPVIWMVKTMIPVFAVVMLAGGVAHACHAAMRLRGLEEVSNHTADARHTHAGASV